MTPIMDGVDQNLVRKLWRRAGQAGVVGRAPALRILRRRDRMTTALPLAEVAVRYAMGEASRPALPVVFAQPVAPPQGVPVPGAGYAGPSGPAGPRGVAGAPGAAPVTGALRGTPAADRRPASNPLARTPTSPPGPADPTAVAAARVTGTGAVPGTAPRQAPAARLPQASRPVGGPASNAAATTGPGGRREPARPVVGAPVVARRLYLPTSAAPPRPAAPHTTLAPPAPRPASVPPDAAGVPALTVVAAGPPQHAAVLPVVARPGGAFTAPDRQARRTAPMPLVDLAAATARAAAEAVAEQLPARQPASPAPAARHRADAAATPGAAAAPRPASAELDIDAVVEVVHRRFVRRLAIEAERRAARR